MACHNSADSYDIGWREARQRSGHASPAAISPRRRRVRSGLLRGAAFTWYWQRKAEARAAARRRLGDEIAAVLLGDALGEVQAESEAAAASATRVARDE